jgi:uncharacterized protein YcbX
VIAATVSALVVYPVKSCRGIAVGIPARCDYRF